MKFTRTIVWRLLSIAAIVLALAPRLAAQTTTNYAENFDKLGTQSNPGGWLDSSVGATAPAANGLYKTWPDPLKSGNVVYGTRQSSGKPGSLHPRIGTFSTLTTSTFSGKGRFEYRGRFLRTDADTRIGLTFFSGAPASDSYYLLGLWENASSKLTMQLFTPAGMLGDSGFTPQPDVWYRFLIQCDDTGVTRIRARFWPDGAEEPKEFNLDVSDGSAARLTSGRIGIWSAVKGDAYVDDLEAKSPVDHTPPSIVLLESGAALDPKATAIFGRDARIEIRVTDDLSSFTSTATLDGQPYNSFDPITNEGAHALHVRAVDDPGNIAEVDLKLVIDKSPPVVKITEAGKLLVSGTLFNRDVIATIVATDLTPVTIEATLDGTPFVSGSAVTAEGTHTLAVKATDSVGFSAVLPPVTFTIDRTPPHIVFTSPAAGETLSTIHPVVTGDADDATAVTVNGVATTIDASRKFTTVRPLDLVEGNNQITAVGSDRAGNLASVTASLRVDTRPPELSVSSPAPDACVSASSIALTGVVADSSGAGVKVKIGDLSADATVGGDGKWTASLAAQNEGRVTVIVSATDPVGHATTKVLHLTVDRTKPVIEVLEAGHSFTGQAVNHAVGLTVDADDADPAVRVDVRLDGAAYVSGTPITTEGAHELRVNATDCAGNAADEKVIAFSIDRTPPVITVVTPASGSTVGERPVVRGNVPPDCTRVVVDGSQLPAAVSSGTFEFASLPWKEGSNSFVFVATDTAGNESRFDYTLTLKTTAPSVSIVEGSSEIAPGSVFRRPIAPRIVASEAAASVSATLNGAAFVSGTTIDRDGDYLLSATATDALGHTSSAAVSFTLDVTAPLISIASPHPNDAIHSDHVEVSGTSSSTDLESIVVNGVVAAVGAGFTALVPLEPGPNLIVAVATDRHGNVSSVSVPVTRDDGRGALVLFAPAEGSLTNRTSTTVAGQILTLTPGATLAINGTSVPFDASGLFRLTGLALNEGSNTITASLRLPNGTVNELTVRLTADFTAPKLQVLANGSPLADGSRFASSPSIAVDASDANGATTAITLDGASIQLPLPPLADGGHSLVVVARDAAGNETRIARAFVVGSASSGVACQLTALDPPDKSAIFGETVRLTGRISGASAVLVNGSRAQFADGSFCATVPLQPGANVIRVECADTNGVPAGTAANITIERQGESAIAITSPRNGDVSASAKTIVTGTVGAGITGGDVNGVTFSVPDDGQPSHTFSVADVPLANGLNVLLARGRTKSGRVAMTSIRVRYFGAAPQIAITSPLPGAESGSSIDVSGTWANLDPASISISAGGATIGATAKAQSDTSGTFSVPPLLLNGGSQTLTVNGRSRSGTPVTATVNVIVTAGGPSIVIDAPADNSFFAADASKASIGGSVSPVAGSNVQVNGVPATIDSAGRFSASVDLASGVTPVVARMTTPGGLGASDSVRLVRFTKPLSVADSYPSSTSGPVDPGVVIVLLMSNPLDGASVPGAVHLTDASGATIDGELFVDRDSISFAPLTPLAPGRTYTISAATSLKDIAGEPLNAPFSLTFSVAGSAASTAPQLDQQDTAGCFSKVVLTGHASAAGVRLRLDVDGVALSTTSAADKSFRFEFTLSGQPGFHLARVREVGADGTLSPEATVCYRVSCSGPQVTSAVLDRSAKRLVITFSKALNPSTLQGAVRVTAQDGTAITGELSLNGSADVVTFTTTADLSTATLTLVVTRNVQDATGIAMAADYSQVFSLSTDENGGRGEGYVSGAVYDAGTGRPLAGAQIDVVIAASSQSTASRRTASRLQAIAFATGPSLTDDRGRYVRTLAEGVYTIQVSASGYATAWRQVIVPAGGGVVPIDVRLTRRGSTATASGGALLLKHGGESPASKAAELSIASGTLPAGKTVCLSSADSQALPALLPLGWSPLAATEIAVDGSPLSAPLPAARLTFILSAADVAALAAAAQTLSFVQYDPGRDEWIVVAAVASVESGGRVSLDLTASGDYALVYPDHSTGLAQPPPARSGAPLRGVVNPCASSADVCRFTSRSFVLDPPTIAPDGTTTATLTVDGAKPFPSGTAVQATIDEQLNLADGRTVVDPPFSTDLLVYRSIAGDTGSAVFRLAPTTQAAAAMLRDGVDHIRIVDYPGRVDRGSIISSEGGRIAGDDTVTLDIPTGAAAEPLHATIVPMAATEIADLGTIAGFRIASGFTLSLSRVSETPATEGSVSIAPSLLKSARATIAIDAAADAQVIVAEVLSATPFGRAVRLAALTNASTAATVGLRTFTTRAIDTAALPVDGIVRSGRYLVLIAQAPIAFAYGQLRSSAGTLIENGRITAGVGTPPTSVLGTADLTRRDGTFVVPVAAKPAALFSVVPSTTTSGDGTAVPGPKNPDRDEAVPLGAITLTANAPHLVGMTPADGSMINASDPFVARATFDAALDSGSAAGAMTITNAIDGKALPGSCSIATNAVTFTPSAALAPGATYVVTVASTVKALNGAPFGRSAVARFSTHSIPVGNNTIRADLIRITIPAAGRSTISGSAGALPAGAQAIAVRRGSYFVTVYQATVAGDGSFSFLAGNPGVDAITTRDMIDLQVVDAVSRGIIAMIPLGPFVTSDGNGFLAPVESTTKFVAANGASITVPAGSFDEPTVITLSTVTKDEFAAVPSFDRELVYATNIRVDFEGVAKHRLDVELPVPAALDPSNRTFYLGYLGDSARGPRVMIVDTLRVANGRFTTAADAASGSSRVRTNATLTGTDLKNALLGVTHAGKYLVTEIAAGAASLAWGIIEGMQGSYDLFSTAFDSLYAAAFYLIEGRGRVAIPVVKGKKFEIVGVDAATGLTAFSKVYDPLPDGDPGAAVIVSNPNPEKAGPYPVFGTPFRIETVKLDVEDIPLHVPNFDVSLSGGFIKAVDAAQKLPASVKASLFNSSNGEIDAKRDDGLTVSGKTGDAVAMFIEAADVDPGTSLSLVFSKKIYTGTSDVDADIDAYLRSIFLLQSSGDPLLQPFTDVPDVHYRVDSGGLRVLIDAPALERGAAYRLIIGDTLADRSGPNGSPGLRVGQAVIGGQKTPARTFTLNFRVRAPGGKIASFDIGSGSIRDEALNGNVLLLSTLDGGLQAWDVADPASVGPSSLLGVAHDESTDSWAVASDHHGRIYSTGLNAMFGFVRSYRLEDFIPDITHPAPRAASQRAGAVVSWAPGASVNMPISSGTVLSDRPEAIPRKLQILLQDNEEPFDSLDAFKAAKSAAVVKTGDDGEFEILSAEVARDADLPYAGQRITIENLSLDLRWSADAHAGAKAHFEGIVARKDDRLRIIRNRMTYGVVSLFGYGIGVYDLNAIESNDDLLKPMGYKTIREAVRLTRGALVPGCGIDQLPAGAIPDLSFSPEAAIVTRDGSSDLFVYGIDPVRGLLDLRIHPPTTSAEAQLPPDAALFCDERPPTGFVVQNNGTTPPLFDPRIAALRTKFAELAKRNPVGRFSGVSYYHWTLEAKDNKLVAPSLLPNSPPLGVRGSVAGQRVTRDYLLVPAFELGLLVFEVGGNPPPQQYTASYVPLSPQHLVDIIWVPSGVYAVRAIPRTNLATVVDGQGRVLLVDLSRIDERFAGNGAPIADDALFATASYCLSHVGAYGVGLADPRIVWQSEPQPDAVSTLAPLIDSDTGFVFRGRLLKKSSDVIAAIDPRIQLKAELAQPGGMSEIGGVIPLGVDPPAAITNLIAAGDPARKANASAAAFRLEVTLPGAIAEKIAASGGQLRVAVESERIAGAAMPQTPEGYPRSHLRLTTKSGAADPRPAAAFVLQRAVPQSKAAALRTQRGFNRFVSPWIIALADPRASAGYQWTYPAGVTTPEAQAAYRVQQGCASCARPVALTGKSEADNVWELLTTGRTVAVRPDLCASNCSQSIFTGTPYEYLGGAERLYTRFSTVPADTVRPTAVLAAAQNPPVAGGALQETTYLHSGEVGVANLDFDFGGRNGWNVAVDRSWRSRTLGQTPLGTGWDSPLFRRLRPLPNGDVEYRDGSELWLFRFKGGSYVSPKGLFLRLARDSRGWRLSDQKHRVTGFDAMGRLSYEADEFAINPDASDTGNVVRYLYDLEGRLVRIVDPWGRETTLNYYGSGFGKSGLLASITDWRNRTIDYDYDVYGRLTTVALPDVPNSSGSRPTIKYGYALPSGSLADSLELSSNLLSITDPGASAPRVSFVYGTSGDLRDRIVRQDWTATGEFATFQYDSPAAMTTFDVLHQRRDYTLTGLATDASSDRAHVLTVRERDVDTSTVAVGALPVSATSGPSRALATRELAFEYNDEGMLKSSSLNGVASTTYGYKSPAGSLGLLAQSSETKPATPDLGEPITREIEYQSGPPSLDVSAFMKSISANKKKIEQSEDSPLGAIADENDAVVRTSELDAYGRTKHAFSAGGTDGSSTGSDTTIAYVPPNGAKHALGRVATINRNDGGTSLTSGTSYPSADLVIETDPRGIITKTKLDAWDRPVDITTDGPGLTMHKTLEYDAAGRVKRETRVQGGAIVTTDNTYDALGRVLSTTTDNIEVNGALKSVTTTTTYDLTQRKIVRTLPGAATVTEILDGLGRTETRKTIAPNEILEEFAYDLAGNQVFAGEKCSSCGAAQWIATATAHDAHGRAVATQNADGSKVVSSGHDGWGNPQTVETLDASGAIASKSTLDFTPSGTLKSSTTDLGGKSRLSEYRWDGAGRSTISSVSGRTSATKFDPLGRVVSASTGEGSGAGVLNPFSSYSVPTTGYSGYLPTNASMKEKSGDAVNAAYDYDTAGNVTKQKIGALQWKRKFDEAGNQTSSESPSRPPTEYSYDGRGALTKEHRADNSDLNHTHDEAGAARSYSDPLETTSTENDLLGRPLKRTYPDGTIEKFTYEGSRVQTYTDRQNRSYVYEHDQAGRLARIMLAGGQLIEQRDYDSAGRVAALLTAEAAVTFSNYDLDGHPHLTRQIRYKNHSGFSSKEVLDDYSQTHDYNEHGERTSFTLPYNGSAPGWTTSMHLGYDAAGNVTSIQRTLSGSQDLKPFLSADYRSAGRPVHRDVFTDCASVAACTPAQILRQYTYEEGTTGQLRQMKVISRGLLVGGSDISYEGLQIKSVKLLGISGDRMNEFTYDERGRLKTSSFGKPAGGEAAEEKLTPYDFREALVRPKTTPVDPPSMTFEHAPGHKIASMTRDGITRKFSYNGGERTDDGRFVFDWDARGRLSRATEKLQPGSASLRRITYEYTATDRIAGRLAEYAIVSSSGTPPNDWKIEDRPEVLATDGLPAQTTFLWDPISDQLLALAVAGATAATDPNGGMLRQILHGGLGYDDPLEVTTAGEGVFAPAGVATSAATTLAPASAASLPTAAKPITKATASLTRTYPVYDAAAGSLQLTINSAGEVISRSIMQGAYGEDTVTLNGVAIDRVAIKANKDSNGNLESVEVTMRATEALDPATVTAGVRLATVTADGSVVRAAAVLPTLTSEESVHWLLSVPDWNDLLDYTPRIVDGVPLVPTSLSIAATNTLRGLYWPSYAAVLPAPAWATASQSVYATAAIPVEIRRALPTSETLLDVLGLDLYRIDSVRALAGAAKSSALEDFAPAKFHALPFADSVVGLDFARARWLDRTVDGGAVSPDPRKYRDSSNLYAYCGGNPVGCSDPTGLAGYFFDGTRNDERTMTNPTNVAKLRRLYQGERFYLPGVGTRWYSKYLGSVTGAGGQSRLYEMYDSLVEQYNRGDKDIDIFGFSRGAAQAIDFANFIRERGIPDKSSAYQQPVGDGMTVTRYRTYFHPEIRFLGLFDAVGSFGMPGDDSDPGHDLSRPTNVRNIRHATARDERRWGFPLTSMLDSPGRSPSNVIEQAFRGAHSDVGGGYADNDELSRLPLGWMWQQATKAGVPLAYLPENERTATSRLVEHDESSWIDSALNWLDKRANTRTIYYQQRAYNPLDYLAK